MEFADALVHRRPLAFIVSNCLKSILRKSARMYWHIANAILEENLLNHEFFISWHLLISAQLICIYLSHLCFADVILQLALMLYCINDLQFSCLGISTLLQELKHADGITYQLQSISIASHYSVRY